VIDAIHFTSFAKAAARLVSVQRRMGDDLRTVVRRAQLEPAD